MLKICDGNKACSDIAYFFSEVCAIYPITPSSPMASNIDLLKNETLNLFDNQVNLIEMQSEAGAAGAIHGALISGSLATTFTSSQGLLLMIPNMYKMAGEMLPAVIHVAARSLATNALSIFGDHSDVYATRSTGFAILSSNNVADAQNMAAIAHLSAIDGSIPFLHFFDGFRTSHEVSSIPELKRADLQKLVSYDQIEKFKNRVINGENIIQKGLAFNEDIYFQTQEARNPHYLALPAIVDKYMQKINQIMHTNYAPFVYYGDSKATNIIIAMGSVCDTIKLVIDEELKKGNKIGLISVYLYRPFASEYLLKALPSTVKNIAVLDRSKEAGLSGEPLYLDVVNSLKNKNINIVGGRYGLSSKNTTPADIKSVYEMLEHDLKNNFTISITDDLTNLSLPKVEYDINLPTQEVLIYGYGSDGLVSASKDILHIAGESNIYVNGYFSYDSKKSGGVTVSNLRFSQKPINAPYYVEHPSLIVISKDEYLKKYQLLNNITDNGTLIINTNKNIADLSNLLLIENYEIIVKRHIKVYIIDASKIAKESGINGKISKIIEMVILNFLNIPNYENILKNNIIKAYTKKGENIVNSNLLAIQKALASLKLITLNKPSTNETLGKMDAISKINHRLGDSLSVKEVSCFKDGTFPGALSHYEKRHVNNLAPKWLKENCIMCGKCSFVCPHSVIRPFLVQEDEGIPFIANKDYNYLIKVSEYDCTECGLCLEECPGKNGQKALEFAPTSLTEQISSNKYFNDYQNPNIVNKFSVNGVALQKPVFEFSGACAGCGETPYINLFTRLYQEELVIANATGCSSIYGASAPSTPYSIAWANSLFEDNAEFALGMHLSFQNKRNLILKIMDQEQANVNSRVQELFQIFKENFDNYEETLKIKQALQKENIPQNLKNLLSYIPKKTILAIGGDGWAYDIGFGGLDHVLSTNENIKVLVLDTEVYSNTGGQMSKSSHLGQVAEFANFGKRNPKKDLFKIAMSYPNCYVASISLGANMMQAIKAIKEAMEHVGPSLIIAYSPCIEQGIKSGMSHSIKEEKLASQVGYNLLMRYNPEIKKLFLDNLEPDFSKYEDFLNNEVRYNALKIKDASLANELLTLEIKNAQERYEYYKKIATND